MMGAPVPIFFGSLFKKRNYELKNSNPGTMFNSVSVTHARSALPRKKFCVFVVYIVYISTGARYIAQMNLLNVHTSRFSCTQCTRPKTPIHNF
jgi:hypothetical protein